MKELWLPITGSHSKYFISSLGRVWSVNVGIMKTPLSKQGYPHCNMWIDGKRLRIVVHVCVAQHFLPNSNGFPVVNHINGIKSDNEMSNLEWCTYSHNELHSIHILGKKHNQQDHRKKTVIATNGKSTIEKLGVRALARELQIPYQAIQKIMKGGRNTYKGWVFRVVEIDPVEAKKVPLEFLKIEKKSKKFKQAIPLE